MDCTTPGLYVSPPVFCDWLDITFPSDCGLWDSVYEFLSDHQSLVTRYSDTGLEFRLPAAEWGNIRLTESGRGWSRLSASGGSCSALRANSAFNEYLALIGGYPYTLTRLDAAMDLPLDGPAVIQSLLSRYPPDSLVYLTRKGVPTDYHLQPVVGGGLTGTFYAGRLRQRGIKVAGRVYDKQSERARFGVSIPPRVRYEIVTRKDMGTTLRDAQEPTLLFWHFAAPALLDAPANMPAWVPYGGESWAPGRIESNDFKRLSRRVDDSLDLESMLKLADKMPDGRMTLFRLIRGRLGLRNIPLSQEENNYA